MLVNHLLTGIILQIMVVVFRIRAFPDQQKTCSSGLAATAICPEMAERFLQRSPWVKHFTAYQCLYDPRMVYLPTCMTFTIKSTKYISSMDPIRMTKHLIFRISPRTGNSGTHGTPVLILFYHTSKGFLWEWYECFRVAGEIWGSLDVFPDLNTRNISNSGKNYGGDRAASGRIRRTLLAEHVARWWFQIFLFSSLPGGDDPIWRASYFSIGLVQPPTRLTGFFFSLVKWVDLFFTQGCLLDKDPVSIWTVRWRFGRVWGGCEGGNV